MSGELSSYAQELEFVCARDGVPVVKNRFDRWFHVDGISNEIAAHDAVPVTLAELRRGQEQQDDFVTLRQAAADMLAHHVVGHPEGACLFAQQLREALSR